MKKNKPYYLKMYYNWATAGRLPSNGLCNCFIKSVEEQRFELVSPDNQELTQMNKKNIDTVYWASEAKRGHVKYDDFYAFTPLRQNLVLLMAALNNEL